MGRGRSERQKAGVVSWNSPASELSKQESHQRLSCSSSNGGDETEEVEDGLGPRGETKELEKTDGLALLVFTLALDIDSGGFRCGSIDSDGGTSTADGSCFGVNVTSTS